VQISESDLGFMRQFPSSSKEQILQKIMLLVPRDSDVHSGERGYRRMMRKLRNQGFGLIDLQPMETAFRTVWYCRSKSLFGWRDSESVAMLLWEAPEDRWHGGSTTVMKWRI